MRAENRFNERKYKNKRKHYEGDKCDKSKCGICSPHKKVSKRNSKYWTKNMKIEKIIDNEILDDLEDFYTL